MRGGQRIGQVSLCVALLTWCAASPAIATFHTFRITEVFSNADGSVQFIEMQEAFGFTGQHLFANQEFMTTGDSLIFPSNLPSSNTADKFVLLATANFAALPGAVSPDYIIPPNFFSIAGDTLAFVGADLLAIGAVPVDGVQSLLRNGSTATNSPTNFAGQSGSVDVSSLNSSPIPKGSITIELEEIASGLNSPVYGTDAGDGSGRFFIVDQAGLIRIFKNGALLPTPFLDLTSLIVTLNPNFDERGVLGLAFHPDFETNGRFFVRYSAPRTGTEADPCFGTSRGCHREVLAEFNAAPGSDVATPGATVLFQIDEPQFNHNAGQVAFGPDDLLYFSLGDGGGAHDGLADVPPSHGPGGHGQNIDTLLGTMLRIDIDAATPYAIPGDNPFVGEPGADEIYAYGFRNPYRFSFDDGPGGTGELWLADVGQALIEEIDIVTKEGNYGWVIKEGTLCFDPLDPENPPASCDDTGMTDPVAEYDHSDGIAVVGGFVYRGALFPELVGKYVFGDFSQSFGTPSGRLFYLDADGTRSDIFEFMLGASDDPLGKFLLGLGRDEAGELYVMTADTGGPLSGTGRVFRIRRGPDDDLDGVVNGDDLCPGTPGGVPVDADGCEIVFGNLTAAVSRRTHGASGTFDLSIPLNGVLREPRANGSAPQTVLTFDTPAGDPGCAGVTVLNGACHGTTTSGNDLIIDMAFDVNACVEVTVGGETVQVLTHSGNVDGNAAVNILDLQAIKNRLIESVNASNFQFDVNTSGGAINILDLQAAKNNLFAPAICP